MVTDLVVELVASGEGVSVLPNWVAAPYGDRVALVPIGRRPQPRTWHLATRAGDQPPAVVDFANLLADHFRTAVAPVRQRAG
ncbi:MAG TPA: LysR substrate-binding domain-containing protein [Kribbellaceae bacterium]